MLEGELFELLEGTSDAAFTVTEQGEIRSWNRAAERLFGYAAAEAVGQACSDLLDGAGALGTKVCSRGSCIPLPAAQRTDVPDFDLEVRTSAGARLWINVSTILFADSRHDQPLIVHLARDITRRKQNEELLSKMVEISRQVAAADGEANGESPVAPLSEQETRVLRLFAKAKSSTETARELGITLPTLRNHLYSINKKLRTHNRLEAVMHAMHRGLI